MYVTVYGSAIEFSIVHYPQITVVSKTLSRQLSKDFEKNGRNTYVRQKLCEFRSNLKRKDLKKTEAYCTNCLLGDWILSRGVTFSSLVLVFRTL